MDFFGFLAQLSFFLTLVAFAMRNVEYLRVAAVGASGAAVISHYYAGEEPMWAPVLWHSAFIAVNTAQFFLTRWRSRVFVGLDPLTHFLHQTVLANFPPAEAKSFAQAGSEGELSAGDQLIKSGSDLQYLFCIIGGRVTVKVNGREAAEVGPGFFVGEMSLLTHSLTRADVFAKENLRLLVWSHEVIEKWVGGDPVRLGLLQTALSKQVVEELLRQNSELVGRGEPLPDVAVAVAAAPTPEPESAPTLHAEKALEPAPSAPSEPAREAPVDPEATLELKVVSSPSPEATVEHHPVIGAELETESKVEDTVQFGQLPDAETNSPADSGLTLEIKAEPAAAAAPTADPQAALDAEIDDVLNSRPGFKKREAG